MNTSIDYACLAVIVNRAAGRGGLGIDAQVQQYLAQAIERALEVFGAFLSAQR